MARVWSYMIIMLTMVIFLSFLGLSPPAVSSTLSDMGIAIGNDGSLTSYDIGNSGWYNILFSGTSAILLAIITGGAIVVGILTRSFDWKLALLPFFTTFVILFVSFGWSIVTMAVNTNEGWLIALISTIFLPLTVMFVFSIVEWFGGVS